MNCKSYEGEEGRYVVTSSQRLVLGFVTPKFCSVNSVSCSVNSAFLHGLILQCRGDDSRNQRDYLSTIKRRNQIVKADARASKRKRGPLRKGGKGICVILSWEYIF